jgi:hypothetical protein
MTIALGTVLESGRRYRIVYMDDEATDQITVATFLEEEEGRRGMLRFRSDHGRVVRIARDRIRPNGIRLV